MTRSLIFLAMLFAAGSAHADQGFYCMTDHRVWVWLHAGSACYGPSSGAPTSARFGQRPHDDNEIGVVLPDPSPADAAPPTTQFFDPPPSQERPYAGFTSGRGMGSSYAQGRMHSPGQSSSPDYGPPVTSNAGTGGFFPSNPNLRNTGFSLFGYSLW